MFLTVITECDTWCFQYDLKGNVRACNGKRRVHQDQKSVNHGYLFFFNHKRLLWIVGPSSLLARFGTLWLNCNKSPYSKYCSQNIEEHSKWRIPGIFWTVTSLSNKVYRTRKRNCYQFYNIKVFISLFRKFYWHTPYIFNKHP